jgi:hypothetical protein
MIMSWHSWGYPDFAKDQMQHEQTDPRRNRINPRVIKRKMSKWKKKRPHHRHLPPLTKTFRDTVVMIR